MAIHQLSSQVGFKLALNVKAITAAVVKGVGIDLQQGTNFPSRRVTAIIIGSPTGAGTTEDVKLQESVDDVDGHYVDVAGGVIPQITTASAAAGDAGAILAILEINPVKRLRWVRLVGTGAGGSAAGNLLALWAFTEGGQLPPTQATAVVVV